MSAKDTKLCGSHDPKKKALCRKNICCAENREAKLQQLQVERFKLTAEVQKLRTALADVQAQEQQMEQRVTLQTLTNEICAREPQVPNSVYILLPIFHNLLHKRKAEYTELGVMSFRHPKLEYRWEMVRVDPGGDDQHWDIDTTASGFEDSAKGLFLDGKRMDDLVLDVSSLDIEVLMTNGVCIKTQDNHGLFYFLVCLLGTCATIDTIRRTVPSQIL